ncbi:bestrophin-like domain [Actinocatenispora rupis]|uniref:DUF4239 domain-containing protein n=1 Tax=Actinocatenispora rupis TaxID=519421 RepID=A0A8J3NDB5_9ACTN|nr:DUF4239 domain-containing protein [Actinocatenispora rupis]GID12727.1 hypothetical protein Aru02nite_36160 [Actinocatenispora rupis]
MSVYLYGTLWIGAACAGAGLLLLLVYRAGDHERRERNNDVNGLVFAIVGVLYAIVVGFVVTSQWESVGNARDAAAQEANGLVQMYWAADALPAEQRTQVRADCLAYGRQVRDVEWPAMSAHETVPVQGQRILERLGRASRPPASASDSQSDQLRDALNTVFQNRQQRLALAHQNLSGMMWFVLFAGGLLTVALAYLFGVPGRIAHLIMVVSLVGTIGLLLYACFQLQYPFGPATDLGPTAMTSALRVFG